MRTAKHCMSRVVGREFLFGDAEKEQFVRYMRLYEKLYDLRILSYVVMSNHFHILVEVPQRPADDALPNGVELIAHVRSCLGDETATSLEWELTHFRENEKRCRSRGFARKMVQSYVGCEPLHEDSEATLHPMV